MCIGAYLTPNHCPTMRFVHGEGAWEFAACREEKPFVCYCVHLSDENTEPVEINASTTTEAVSTSTPDKDEDDGKIYNKSLYGCQLAIP